MSAYRRLIEEVGESPALIFRGRHAELKAVRYVQSTHLGPKYFVVVYKQLGPRKDIITAYFTSEPKRIGGEVI